MQETGLHHAYNDLSLRYLFYSWGIPRHTRVVLALILLTVSMFCTACSKFYGGQNPEVTPTKQISIDIYAEDLILPPTPTVQAAIPSPEASSSADPHSAAMDESHSGTLSGKVFFDLDSNGLQDENEAGIAGARVCIETTDDTPCTLSEDNGAYKSVKLDNGHHKLHVFSPTNDPTSAMRFISISKGYVDLPGYYINGDKVPKQYLPDTKILSIDSPLEVTINGITPLDIGLMQGYLTDVFACQDRELISDYHGYDLDPREGQVRNYLGDTTISYGPDGSSRTVDGHAAIDWGNTNQHIIGIYVRAAAPGIVAFAGEDPTTHGNCRMVSLAHPDTGQKTGYVHLDRILVKDGQYVQRGQILGSLGQSCTDWPHVHFFFNPGWDPKNPDWSNKDPFRDIRDPDSLTWWTRDNEPVCGELRD
ncbi:peptidoglycan DD-metalloendopeptidase family protein [Chloroflexota bacterium]